MIDREPIVLSCPGSKSMTQRALMIAALAEAPVTIDGALSCDDSRYLTELLLRLGVAVTWSGTRVEVRPQALRSDGQPLYCGNAGTAVRFASCLSLVCEGELHLDGDVRMRQRPLGPLVTTLDQLGVTARYLGAAGCPPVVLRRAGEVERSVSIDASLSSQYASGLLLVAPRLPEGLELELTGAAVSMPYLQMTVEMMRRAGAAVEWPAPHRVQVAPRPYRVSWIDVEPDWSTAAFLLAAGEISGQPVMIEALPEGTQSLQGDALFAEYLEELRRPHPHRIDLSGTPDLIAPIAAVALFAEQPTTVWGAAHVRIKESDRIRVLAQELAKVGARVEELPDGLVIHPLQLEPGQRSVGSAPIALDPHDDHRMAMAFGLLSLRLDGLVVEHPECVSKSFPEFWEVLQRFPRDYSR